MSKSNLSNFRCFGLSLYVDNSSYRTSQVISGLIREFEDVYFVAHSGLNDYGDPIVAHYHVLVRSPKIISADYLAAKYQIPKCSIQGFPAAHYDIWKSYVDSCC